MSKDNPVIKADESTWMPRDPKDRQTKPDLLESSGSDVIVDFVFDDGLFFISISNISDTPAYKVSVKFHPKICRLDGKNLAALPLFQNIEFLAPHKAIVMFLESSGSYFSRGGPTKVSARISYEDARGRKRQPPSITIWKFIRRSASYAEFVMRIEYIEQGEPTWRAWTRTRIFAFG